MSKNLNRAAYILLAAGVLNFLLGDLFGYNVVDETLGKDSALAWTVYAAMGVSGVYVLYDRVRAFGRKS